MGKTVKSRTIFSIATFLFVVAFCLVANSSVPKFYESYKQKAVAQQASSQKAEPVKKDIPVEEDIPSEEPVEEAPVEEDTSFTEDSEVYDIPEETPVEEAPVEEEEEEEPEEDFDFDVDIGGDEEESGDKSSGGFLEMIISFITSLIDKITSLDIFGKLKDFFASILKFFGIEL